MTTKKVRRGCKDVWNAFMVEGATFGKYDIPYCPTTATKIIPDQVTWEEAKQIHRKRIASGDSEYYIESFINWNIDDYKFDGTCGIWNNYNDAYNIIKHFTGVITPDFSTYQDFPEAIKIYATYRMRAFGFWLGNKGIAVVNNVRWGTEETYKYCFEGIPTNSIVAIGTVGGGPRKLEDRERFENGLSKMVEILSPHTIMVYGSANYDCFEKLIEKGINVVACPSRTAKFFEGRKQHE